MIQTIPLVMDDDDGGGDEEQDIRIIGGGGGGGMIIGEEEAEESFSLSSLMFSLSPSSSIGSRGRQRGRRKGGDSVDPLLHELMDIDDIVKYIVNDDEQSFLSSSSSACEEMWRRNVEYSNKVPAALSASRFLSPIITEPVVCNSMDLSSMWKIVFSKMSYWWQLEKKKWIYDVTRFVQVSQ